MVHTLADITGDGSAHPLIANNVRTAACWVNFNCPTSNSATSARVGDKNVSATQGTPIAAGAGQMFPPIGTTQYLDLSQVWYLLANGDTMSVTYALA